MHQLGSLFNQQLLLLMALVYGSLDPHEIDAQVAQILAADLAIQLQESASLARGLPRDQQRQAARGIGRDPFTS